MAHSFSDSSHAGCYARNIHTEDFPMPGKPENRQSARELPSSARAKSSGSGTVSGSEVGSKGSGGIRFKMQGSIIDHSKVRETIGRR